MKMNLHDEMKEWAGKLKPGDKVVLELLGPRGCIDVLEVERITPTGRIVTNKGTYGQSKYSGYYKGYGEAIGVIVPAINENVLKAERNKAKEEKEMKDREAVRTAGTIAWKIWREDIKLTPDMAMELISLWKKWEGNGDD